MFFFRHQILCPKQIFVNFTQHEYRVGDNEMKGLPWHLHTLFIHIYLIVASHFTLTSQNLILKTSDLTANIY